MATQAVVRYLSEDEAKSVRERKRVVVDRELDRLIEKHGSITVNLVLDSARREKSALHRYFDWDDGVAAEKWRRVQALQLIMASKMVAQLVEQNDRPVPAIAEHAHVRRLVSAFSGQGFTMRADALADEEQRKALVNRHVEKLRSWLRATIDIAELEPIRKKITRALPRS